MMLKGGNRSFKVWRSTCSPQPGLTGDEWACYMDSVYRDRVFPGSRWAFINLTWCKCVSRLCLLWDADCPIAICVQSHYICSLTLNELDQSHHEAFLLIFLNRRRCLLCEYMLYCVFYITFIVSVFYVEDNPHFTCLMYIYKSIQI